MCKLSEQMARDDANYEEAQSRLRMSMLCRDCVRPLVYPLSLRIVEFAQTRSLGRRGDIKFFHSFEKEALRRLFGWSSNIFIWKGGLRDKGQKPWP